MPFINETNQRATLQQFGRYEFQPETDFGETFAASVGQVIDEELSISTLLNRDGYETRNRLIDERIKTGEIDAEPYRKRVTGRPGQAASEQVDYGRIAQDLNDPNIKPDSVLHEERNEMLRQRREYAQDVQERGPMSATILGTLTAAMLDPLNIATVGIAAPITVGKSLTTLGRVALAARNAALVEGAVELGIQGFVYAHKKDIDSPYSAGDALANIAFAAGGAAVVGGAAAGVSGWLRRVIGYSKELPPSKDVDASLDYLERMAAMLESARAQRFDTYDIALNDYQKLLDGEYSDFIEASNKTIATLETELNTITKQAPTLDKFIADNGGLNRALISAEGADIADMKAIKGGFGKPVFRANGGMTVEDLEELLNEANFRGGFVTRNEVLEIVDAVARGETVFMNPEDAAKVDFLGNQIDEFRFNQDDDYLRKLYGEIRERDVQADIDFMREMDKRAQEYAGPQKTADMYAEPPATRKPARQRVMPEHKSEHYDTAATFYHGTSADFDNFDLAHFGKNEPDGDYIGEAFFFTRNKMTAEKYGKKVKEAKLYMRNPLVIKKPGDREKFLERLIPVTDEIRNNPEFKGYSDQDIREFIYYDMTPREKREATIRLGYDGLIDDLYGQAAVFNPEQIYEAATAKAADKSLVDDIGRAHLERNGLTEAYDADLEAYRALENPLIEIDGEQINAADIMKEFDDELTGLESVLTCVIGGSA